jgi:hypothetical protein
MSESPESEQPRKEAEAPPRPLPVAEGDLFLERYELGQALAEGGMASVFEARERSASGLGASLEAFVVKLLAPALVGQAEQRRRFLSSAALQARLCLPGVGVVRDYGETPDGWPYMIMPRDLALSSLRVRLSAGAMSCSEVVLVLRSLLRTLSSLHDRGVVHRDLKPSNILLRARGDGELIETQLIDFGIAKDLAATESLTATGASPGMTPEYAAPELHRSSGDARSDLYALGVTANEMLTGKALAGKGPRDLGARVPRRFDRLVRRMCDTDPEARPASATAALAELEAIAHEPRLAWLGLLLSLALVVAALGVGKARLDEAEARAHRAVLAAAEIEAERDRLLEEAARGRSAESRPPTVTDTGPDPVAASLSRYRQLDQQDREFWRATPSPELVEGMRDRWADLAQQASIPAVRDAASARVERYDALALRRSLRLELRWLERPFEVAGGALYLDLSAGDRRQRFEAFTVESKEGVVRLSPAAESAIFELELTGRVGLRLELFEDRAWGFDRQVFEASVELVIPARPGLSSGGLELELEGPAELRIGVALRSP